MVVDFSDLQKNIEALKKEYAGFNDITFVFYGGEFKSGTRYRKNTIVTKGERLYIALKDVSGAFSATDWHLLAGDFTATENEIKSLTAKINEIIASLNSSKEAMSASLALFRTITDTFKKIFI